MSTETNKATVQRFFEDIINGGNPAAAMELFAPEYQLYFAGNPPMSAQETAEFIGGAFRSAFPDLRDEVLELLADGDAVAARGITHGTHQGTFMGVPATGRTIAVDWISLFRLTPEGRIRESRVAFDQLGMMQQIGAVPAMAYRSRAILSGQRSLPSVLELGLVRWRSTAQVTDLGTPCARQTKAGVVWNHPRY